MAGRQSAFRGRLFKGVHAEAAKRGLDHDGLRDLCHRSYGVRSMSEISDSDLMSLYKSFTGKGLRRRARLPQRGEAAANPGVETIITGEELLELDREFAKRSMGEDSRRNFVRRQLRGRDRIVSRRDYSRVLGGLRAMNRREGL